MQYCSSGNSPKTGSRIIQKGKGIVTDTALVYAILRVSYYVIFVGLHIALMLGIFLEWLRERKALSVEMGELPTVSVIIPVHNESRRMESLLQSLEAV